jgi:hypothetical protein
MNRNLDGIYFRIKRDNKYENICFSDLTVEEMQVVMNDKGIPWLRSICTELANTIKDIGEQFNIVNGDED